MKNYPETMKDILFFVFLIIVVVLIAIDTSYDKTEELNENILKDFWQAYLRKDICRSRKNIYKSIMGGAEYMKSIKKYETIINEALRSALEYDTPRTN